MVKKEQKGFKEYTQRWRELATQVQPPIMEREMVMMFIDTLPSPYYDKIVGNVASNFADLVAVGERIELGIRRGKFAQTSNNAGFAKKPTLEKKKGETTAVLVELVFHQTKANIPSYLARIQVGSRATIAPPVPYIPLCPPRADVGMATTTRLA
ncbi:hypothetical protein CR513_21280, partial [Mucuna pruriens]